VVAAAAAPESISLERKRRSHVEVSIPGREGLPPEAMRAAMADYLSDPGRALRFLLNRDKLSRDEDGRFRYRSSSLRVLRWRFEPQVLLTAQWQGDGLAIRFEECQLQGLGDLAQWIDFGLEALLTPADDGFDAFGRARLQVQRRGLIRLLPEALLESAGRKMLRKVLKRMEKRCHQGLRLGACRWLHRETG
jgi:hypothetical protein